MIAERDAGLADPLDQQFAAATAALQQYRQGDGWLPYTA